MNEYIEMDKKYSEETIDSICLSGLIMICGSSLPLSGFQFLHDKLKGWDQMQSFLQLWKPMILLTPRCNQRN